MIKMKKIFYLITILLLLLAPGISKVRANSLPQVDLRVNGSNGPITIQLFTRVNLTWVATNAQSCQSSTFFLPTGSPTSGSYETSPLLYSRIYDITCVNSLGQAATDSVTVNVEGAEDATTASLLVKGQNDVGFSNSTVIDNGQSIEIKWSSANAASCEKLDFWATDSTIVNPNVNGVKLFTNLQSALSTYRFGLKCVNSSTGAQATSYVSINVNTAPIGAPQVDLKANGSNGPLEVNSGEQVLLSWTTQNVRSCTANFNPSPSIPSGTQMSSAINTDTVFNIICVNDVGDQAFDSVLVNIKNTPITSDAGITVTVSWSSYGVTQKYILKTYLSKTNP